MSGRARTQRESTVPQSLRAPGLPLILTVAIIVVGIAALLPLIQSSGATTTNGHIGQLEREQTDWQARVQEAEAQLAYLSSLNRVEQEAKKRFDMRPPEQVIYIAVPLPGPQQETLPARFLPPPAQEAPAGEAWSEKIFGWLPLP